MMGQSERLSGSFEQDLAAILGKDGAAPRSATLGVPVLLLSPLMILVGVVIVAFAQREDKLPQPAVALHVATPLPPIENMASRKAQPAPQMVVAKPAPSSPRPEQRVAAQTGRVDLRSDRRSRRREAMAAVSYSAPSAAMFAQAQETPAPEKQKMEEREERGNVDVETERKRLARLAAQDAVRSLRLR